MCSLLHPLYIYVHLAHFVQLDYSILSLASQDKAHTFAFTADMHLQN